MFIILIVLKKFDVLHIYWKIGSGLFGIIGLFVFFSRGGFWLGVVLLLSAVFLFMISEAAKEEHEKIKAKEAAQQAAAPSTKQCPHCLNFVPAQATRCGFCTSHLH
jgi:preprotein translocase subunit SecG